MEFLKNFDFKPMSILKVAGVAIAAILLLVIAFRLVDSSFKSVLKLGGVTNSQTVSKMAMDFDEQVMMEGAMMDTATYGSDGMVGLSVRNLAIEPEPDYGSNIVVGDNAEQYEITEYYATVKTSDLEFTCSTVADLKIKDYVIFENSNEYDTGCHYRFKVKQDNVEEILAVIESLDPRDLTESAYTIKNLVDDYTSEVEILENKLESIDNTLNNAVEAYDDITDLASRTQDVESLAKIIDSKIRIIERLTNEKIRVNEQLDRLSRSKAEQLDRLNYTYFNIDIFEDKYIDGDNLKDSWKLAIKNFVRDINKVAQDITVNLVALIFVIIQYALYLLILIVVAKYGWQLIKRIWKK